jgi:hypothetical protein
MQGSLDLCSRRSNHCATQAALVFCYYPVTVYGQILPHMNINFTITEEGLQILDLCSTLVAFEQGDIFIAPHVL